MPPASVDLRTLMGETDYGKLDDLFGWLVDKKDEIFEALESNKIFEPLRPAPKRQHLFD